MDHSSRCCRSRYWPFGKIVWLHQVTWTLTLPLICLSILLLYLRLFPKTWLNKGSYIAAGLTVTWWVAQTFALIFQCTPVQYFWNRKIPNGHCIHENQYYAAACSISMINIIVVFCLPLPIIWKLHISRSKKWSLVIAFCIGVLYASPDTFTQCNFPTNALLTWAWYQFLYQ